MYATRKSSLLNGLKSAFLQENFYFCVVKELDGQGIVLRFPTRAEVFLRSLNFHIRPRNGCTAAKQEKKTDQAEADFWRELQDNNVFLKQRYCIMKMVRDVVFCSSK